VPQDGANATIVRWDGKLAWRLLSQQRIYRERPIALDEQLFIEERLEHEIARDLIRSEEREGFSWDLFHVTTREGDKPAAITAGSRRKKGLP
jgi:hypothetical protein